MSQSICQRTGLLRGGIREIGSERSDNREGRRRQVHKGRRVWLHTSLLICCLV